MSTVPNPESPSVPEKVIPSVGEEVVIVGTVDRTYAIGAISSGVLNELMNQLDNSPDLIKAWQKHGTIIAIEDLVRGKVLDVKSGVVELLILDGTYAGKRLWFLPEDCGSKYRGNAPTRRDLERKAADEHRSAIAAEYDAEIQRQKAEEKRNP